MSGGNKRRRTDIEEKLVPVPQGRKMRRAKSDSNHASAASGSVSVPRSAIVHLQDALMDCDAPDLVHALAIRIAKVSSQDFSTLEDVLTPLVRANQAAKHCVRCHKSYKESSNTINSCAIPCHEPQGSRKKDPGYDDKYMYTFTCCGKDVGFDEGSNWELGDPTCFTAKHTTDPTSIRYHGYWRDGEAKNGLFYDPDANHNLITCEAKGCGKRKSKKRS